MAHWAEGRRWEKHPWRRIVDAIFYGVRTGCAWRQLPKDLACFEPALFHQARAGP
ncbi:transposase [Streptomyces sp. NPDC057460]|uniref:transposase n=1 Tax=Streptomyces sp. NPDC057460 TaxID=3346141 RepID=UPI0036D160E3